MVTKECSEVGHVCKYYFCYSIMATAEILYESSGIKDKLTMFATYLCLKVRPKEDLLNLFMCGLLILV